MRRDADQLHDMNDDQGRETIQRTEKRIEALTPFTQRSGLPESLC